MDQTAEIRRKRVYFRSHHTGMKENNILLGDFSEIYLDSMTNEDVEWYENFIMNNNDLDIYNWILGRTPVPPELEHPVMRLLVEFRKTV